MRGGRGNAWQGEPRNYRPRDATSAQKPIQRHLLTIKGSRQGAPVSLLTEPGARCQAVPPPPPALLLRLPFKALERLQPGDWLRPSITNPELYKLYKPYNFIGFTHCL